MQNWSVDIEKLKKYPLEYKRWKTEQMLNFGMEENEKLDRSFVKKNLKTLEIDTDMRSYLEYSFAHEAK